MIAQSLEGPRRARSHGSAGAPVGRGRQGQAQTFCMPPPQEVLTRQHTLITADEYVRPKHGHDPLARRDRGPIVSQTLQMGARLRGKEDSLQF